jgi:hypothetical protein
MPYTQYKRDSEANLNLLLLVNFIEEHVDKKVLRLTISDYVKVNLKNYKVAVTS